MKNVMMAAAAACMLLTTACATPGKLESAVTSGAVPQGATAQERLEILKEVNRHIEGCDRTYAWPLAVTWVCKAKQDGDQVAKMITDAVNAAVTAALAAKALPNPIAP